MPLPPISTPFFFFNDTATTEIYTLSLHDALPICGQPVHVQLVGFEAFGFEEHLVALGVGELQDRKSTRLNSSHLVISYAVFCLKKKNRQRAGWQPFSGRPKRDQF